MIHFVRHLSFILACCTLFLSYPALSQTRSTEKISREQKSKTIKPPTSSPKEYQKNKVKIISQDQYSPKNFLEDTDTLNFPLEGEYSLYYYAGGYVSGNNEYGDKVKANYFECSDGCYLSGVLIDFAWATSSDAIIEIAAWDKSGIAGAPGNKLGSTTIELDEIFIDVLNEQTTFISFDNPIAISSNGFYVGAYLPTGTDTLAIYTNTDGDTNPATAWEQWSDNSWYPYDDPNSWEFKVSHAIFPIVNMDIGLVANFFASSTSINPGQSIDFFDTSIGDPVSWQWTFEGGNPGASNAENPEVIYEDEGLYDVKLIVGDGTNYDTLTRNDYILVTNEIPVEVDTLIFPLEGTYTVYILENNQGFVCGTNLWNDLAKANYFTVYEPIKITGLLVDFLWAAGGNPEIDLNIWNNNGEGGVPGSILASSKVELNTIKSDIANQMLTYVAFDPPVVLNHSFYAGFELPTAAGDTLAVWSNEHGDTNPGIAWEWWEDGSWYPFSTAPSWELSLAMGIHPIVEYQTGINDIERSNNLIIYPNPTSSKFILESTETLKGSRIDLLDISGLLLQSIKLSGNSLSNEIDISNYPSGTYFIRLTNKDEVVFKKIIKN